MRTALIRVTASTGTQAASARQTGMSAGPRRARTGPSASTEWPTTIAAVPMDLQVIKVSVNSLLIICHLTGHSQEELFYLK